MPTVTAVKFDSTQVVIADDVPELSAAATVAATNEVVDLVGRDVRLELGDGRSRVGAVEPADRHDGVTRDQLVARKGRMGGCGQPRSMARAGAPPTTNGEATEARSRLFLLHGYPESRSCWHQVAPELGSDRRVIAPDLRGYGASDGPPGGPKGEGYRKREMASDVVALLDALEIERAHIVGHDRGARVAYRLALDHADRATTLGASPVGQNRAMTDAESTPLTAQTVELLQQMIRNRCVNDGTPTSGEEVRNADLLTTFLEGRGLDVQHYDAAPGRRSMVARIEGTDPTAPSLCLMGHTDVVPANAAGWTRDPFGGELVGTEVWGRGAVDMLNLTSSMAVAFRHLADTGFRPRGNLIFFGVADEESGSAHGMRWMADHAADDVRADYVLTENGGLHSGSAEAPSIGVTVGEKGVAWRRLRVRGTPGHGSMPYRSDNALVKAAAVITKLTEYRPAPRVHELWRERIDTLGLPEDLRAKLLDPASIDEAIDAMPGRSGAGLHAGCHTTFSCNVVEGNMKTNVIPDCIDLGVDVRTLPGEDAAAVDSHLRAALGPLYDTIEVELVMNDTSTISRTDTPLWDSLARAITRPFPTSRLSPQLSAGFTDSRIYRELGAVSYGAGLLSPEIGPADFGYRFHGNDERIDIESLRLTTQLWLDVVRDFLG